MLHVLRIYNYLLWRASYQYHYVDESHLPKGSQLPMTYCPRMEVNSNSCNMWCCTSCKQFQEFCLYGHTLFHYFGLKSQCKDLRTRLVWALFSTRSSIRPCLQCGTYEIIYGGFLFVSPHKLMLTIRFLVNI